MSNLVYIEFYVKNCALLTSKCLCCFDVLQKSHELPEDGIESSLNSTELNVISLKEKCSLIVGYNK